MSLLELAKKLNIPRRNCMKTNQELEKAKRWAGDELVVSWWILKFIPYAGKTNFKG